MKIMVVYFNKLLIVDGFNYNCLTMLRYQIMLVVRFVTGYDLQY